MRFPSFIRALLILSSFFPPFFFPPPGYLRSLCTHNAHTRCLVGGKTTPPPQHTARTTLPSSSKKMKIKNDPRKKKGKEKQTNNAKNTNNPIPRNNPPSPLPFPPPPTPTPGLLLFPLSFSLSSALHTTFLPHTPVYLSRFYLSFSRHRRFPRFPSTSPSLPPSPSPFISFGFPEPKQHSPPHSFFLPVLTFSWALFPCPRSIHSPLPPPLPPPPQGAHKKNTLSQDDPSGLCGEAHKKECSASYASEEEEGGKKEKERKGRRSKRSKKGEKGGGIWGRGGGRRREGAKVADDDARMGSSPPLPRGGCGSGGGMGKMEGGKWRGGGQK